MTSKKVKLIFLLLSIALISLSFIFTGFMNISSFEKSYTSSTVNKYAVLGKKAVRTLSYAIQYGKPLENFYGIEDILQELNLRDPDIEDIWLVDGSGHVLYSAQEKAESLQLNDALVGQLNDKKIGDNEENVYDIQDDCYHVLSPIYDQEYQLVGALDIMFDEKDIKTVIKDKLNTLIAYAAVISVGVTLVLAIIIYRINFFDNQGLIQSKKISMILIIVLGISQILYCALTFNILKNGYMEAVDRNISVSLEMMHEDINSVLNKGVNYEELYGIETWMADTIGDVPEIGRISIMNYNDQTLFATEDLTASLIDFSNKKRYTLPLNQDKKGVSATINMSISSEYMQKKFLSIMLDMITILLTSIFFMVELSSFLVLIFKKNVYARQNINDSYYDINIVRTLAFLFFIGCSMSGSFIILRMNELYEPIANLSKNLVLSLPLSFQMLFGSFATFFMGDYIDQRGWRPIFFIGLIITCVGTLSSALASNAWLFIASRSIVGIGYATAILAMGGFVAKTARNDVEKTKGFAANTTGIYAGSICGVAIGGMLAERIGYASVFYVMCFVLILVGVFTYVMFVNKLQEEARWIDDTSKVISAVTKKEKWSFFIQKPILSFYLFILLPLTISTFFLQYFFPIYAHEMKVSASNISRVFMLVDLIIAYIAPIVIIEFRRRLGFKKSIMIATLICAFSLIIFGILPSMPLAVMVALFLGLGEGIGLNLNKNYYINLEEARKLGTGKALGYYSVVRNIAQFMGPIIFSLVLSMGIGLGSKMIGLIITLLVVMFAITNYSKISSKKYS